MVNAMLIRFTKDYEVAGLGAKIRAARDKSDKSITDLASLAGMSVAYWYRIEKEAVKALPAETVRAIERALGVDLLPKLD